MQPIRTHPREQDRLSVLRELEILDTAPEQAYDDVVDLAARSADAPIALISLVDEGRYWFKAKYGLTESDESHSYGMCKQAILTSDAPFVVNDTLEDDRFADDPMVTSGPKIRFYTGVPLKASDDSLPVGTLCVLDQKPRTIDPQQLDALRMLARLVEMLFSLRKQAKELQVSNDELKQATQAKSHFLSSISHDIRTPLSAIIGLSGLLESEALTETGKEYVETIQKCSNSLLHQLNNILDISRIESGLLQIELGSLSLRELLNDVALIIQPMANEKGLHVTIDIDDSLDHVIGDESKLHKIVLNLVSNAAKFTKAGTIKLRAFSVGTGRVRIEVEDSGPGISESDLKKIGQPFTQVGHDCENKRKGCGLGLSIVKSTVEAMNGELKVKSKLGKGSIFSVTLALPKTHSKTN